MDTYHIKRTEKEDLNFIYSMYDAAIAYQKKKNYPVWRGYDKGVLQNDVKLKRQFKLLCGNDIACIFSILFSDPVVWRERDNGEAIYLHRIVVNPAYKGRFLFNEVLKNAKIRAIKENRHLIRMDTWDHNPDLVNYYQGFGFELVEHYATPNDERLPFQDRGNDIVLLEYRIPPSSA